MPSPLLLLPALVSSPLHVDAHAELGSWFGDTLYAFEAELESGDPDVGRVTGGSKLEWPIDFVLAGAAFGVSEESAEGRPWRVGVSILTDLGDARGTMRDSDYIEVPLRHVPRTKFSYTESDTESSALVADLELRVALPREGEPDPDVRIEAVGGYRHEHFVLDAYGADGWQLTDSGRFSVGLPYSIHALRYTVDRGLPNLGVAAEKRDAEGFVMRGDARLLGVISRDVDDHVLRNKRAHIDTFGLGLLLSGEPALEVSRPGDAVHLTLGLPIEVEWVHGWGTISQKFYDDDPSSEGDETRVDVPDTDVEISSLRLELGVRLSAAF